MAEDSAAVETQTHVQTQTSEKKGLLWFLSEMNLWSLWERYASATTPLEAYDPERMARLRKTAATVGAGEAVILAAGIPAIYACLNGVLYPFAGELSPPWNHIVFGLMTLWPLLVTTIVIWWSIPKIVGDVTASIAKNFVLLRGLVLCGIATLAAAFEAALLPRFISPETIYSCMLIPKPMAINGYIFWQKILGVLTIAAPRILTAAVFAAGAGLLPVLLRAYRVTREKEIYEQIRGEV